MSNITSQKYGSHCRSTEILERSEIARKRKRYAKIVRVQEQESLKKKLCVSPRGSYKDTLPQGKLQPNDALISWETGCKSSMAWALASHIVEQASKAIIGYMPRSTPSGQGLCFQTICDGKALVSSPLLGWELVVWQGQCW